MPATHYSHKSRNPTLRRVGLTAKYGFSLLGELGGYFKFPLYLTMAVQTGAFQIWWNYADADTLNSIHQMN
jgi:hypothetical protein